MFSAINETWRAVCRIYRLFSPKQKRILIVAMIMMAITGSFAAVPPLLIGILVDGMLASEFSTFRSALPFLALIFVVIVTNVAITVFRKWMVEDLCTRVQKDQTERIIGHLLCVDLAVFNDERLGSLNGRLHRSIEGLIRLIKLGFLQFFPAVFCALCALTVAAYNDVVIGCVMFASVFVSITIVLWQVASQKGIRIDLLRSREALDGTIVEVLGGIETVRATNTERIESTKVASVTERMRSKEILHHIQMALFDAGKFLCESGFHIAVIGLAIWFAIQERISIGEVLTYSMLYLGVATPLRELHRILDEAHESTLRVLDFFDLLDNFPKDTSFDRIEETTATNMSGSVPIIEFDHVDFAYTNASRNAVSEFSIAVEKGSKVAIVGRSGSGKSTVAKLALLLMKVGDGQIRLGGVPISKLTRAQIAASIGYISQFPFVFSGTVIENISYGCDNVSMDDVVLAAKSAELHDEIISLGGYDSLVSERGNNLSGGQRQRLALARLFLKKPELIILDEATASLDNVTESAVQIAIDTLMNRRTVIVIAHRLNTIRNADAVLVMDAGSLVEAGTFEDLTDANGALSRLAMQVE